MKLSYIFFAVMFIVSALMLTHCSESDSSGGNSGIGTGGSLNKFTIADSFLYVINLSHIETYQIDKGKMEFIAATYIDNDIETVFPFDSLVLVGGRLGMYICERRANGELELISKYEHVESCDPVVTDGTYAYVTLSSGCRNQFDQLDILDVTDIYNPVLLKTYPMENPKGLGVDESLLFICDTSDGLKIYDRSDPVNITLIEHFTYLYPYDVIPYNGLLFVMTDNSIYQYDYRDPANIFELSQTLLQ